MIARGLAGCTHRAFKPWQVVFEQGQSARFPGVRGLGLVAAAVLLLPAVPRGQQPALTSGRASVFVHAESGTWFSPDPGRETGAYSLDQPMVVGFDGKRPGMSLSPKTEVHAETQAAEGDK